SHLPATPFPRYARDDSGSCFVVFLLDLLQKRFDASGAGRRLVVTEIELGRKSQTNALTEEVANPAALRVQINGDLLRLLFVQSADEDARQMQIRAHLHLGHRHHRQAAVFQIAPEDFADAAADGATDAGGALWRRHWRASITSEPTRSSCFGPLRRTRLQSRARPDYRAPRGPWP